jgi:antitoxin CcdA
MNKPSKFDVHKRATNVSLAVDLVEEAKRLGINLSQACEAGLADRVRLERGEEWKRENRAAIESSNEYVRKNGLPLARYRMF